VAVTTTSAPMTAAGAATVAPTEGTSRWLQPDLLALAGAGVTSAVWALLGVPLLGVVGGLLLPVPVQGAAVGLAVLPLTARRGLAGTLGVLGVAATITEVLALDLTGVAITRPSITLVCLLVTAAALLGAAVRRVRPQLPTPQVSPGSALAIGTACAATVAMSVLLGTTIPIEATQGYSTLAFVPQLARTGGVMNVAVGQPVPLAITIANAQTGAVDYRVSLAQDARAGLPVTTVSVPAGASRQVAVGTVRVHDGCLHRFAVRARSSQTYLLTLYLKAGDASCPHPAARAATTP
jgi:hypothetical protein